MSLMGRHSTPLAGVTIANGHSQATQGPPALVPFTVPQLQVRPRGPMAPWPQQSRWRHARRVMSAHRTWLAAVPIVLVNAVAFTGQLAFLRTHLPWPLPGQVLVAVTLESVAVYLAWQAHLALAADDSAMRLRLAAYGFAAVIGVMNYSHYMAAHWRPTFAAITFGLMSVSSPWLWSVHSRRVSRDALKERGLIEPHAVRLGATRWQWHPVRSVRVMSYATWAGETDPAAAIAAWQPRKSGAQVAVTAAPQVTPASPVQVSPEPGPGQPLGQAKPVPQVSPRRRAQVKAGTISDADLKEKLRPVVAANPSVSINAAAKAVGRGRDRVRPLLEELRRELTGASS